MSHTYHTNITETSPTQQQIKLMIYIYIYIFIYFPPYVQSCPSRRRRPLRVRPDAVSILKCAFGNPVYSVTHVSQIYLFEYAILCIPPCYIYIYIYTYIYVYIYKHVTKVRTIWTKVGMCK